MTESEITNRETIESGERFQFVAISNAWKNQRRKRRQQAREQQNADDKMDIAENTGNREETSNVIPEKRMRIDEERVVERVWDRVKNSESPPLLHIEVSVQSKTLSELKAIVEIKLTYLNGTSGLNGVYEILQYIQNKWSK